MGLRAGTILLLSLMWTVGPVSAAPVAEYASGSDQMVRTELYFGAIAAAASGIVFSLSRW